MAPPTALLNTVRCSPGMHLSKLARRAAPRWLRWPARGESLSTSMDRDANNYDLLRLLLALAVIFGHAGAISVRTGYVDAVRWLIGFDYSGGLAVKAFFFLSGLFVADSIVSSRSAVRFAVMRAARLIPGLLACLVVTTVIVGPVFTELPVADYLRNPLTHSYAGANLALTDLQWRLPGVFADSRYGVNGSLWTIPIEVRLYFFVFVLHLIGAFDRRSSAALATGIAGYFALAHPDLLFGGQQSEALVLCFLGGIAAAVHKRDVPMHGTIAMLAWLCALAARSHAVFYCAALYSLLYIFRWPALTRLRLPGDFSYGVYLYGFVVQQAFAGLFPAAHPLVNAVVCMAVATAMAVLSWYCVERPALSAARRLCAASGMDHLGAPALVIAAWVGAAATVLLLPRALPVVPGLNPAIAASPDLNVVSYGPVSVTHGQGFNIQPDGSSAIWVKLSRPTAPDAELRLGVSRLASVATGDLVTAKVPERIFATASRLDLLVIEQVRGRMFAAPAVPWDVR